MEVEFHSLDRMLYTYLIFGLALIRCSGLVVFAPFFGSEFFPQMARIGFAVFLGIISTPLASKTAVLPQSIDMAELGLLAMQELAIGLTLGFLSGLVFMAAQMAGHLMGMQMGFSMANIVDPLTGDEVEIIGYFQMQIMIVLFLVLNLHVLLAWCFCRSFEFIGIGTLTSNVLIETLIKYGEREAGTLMIIAFQLAIPVMLVM